MKKRNIYKPFLLALIIIITTLNGCDNEEFFELKRPPEFPWQSVSEFELAAEGAYNKALTYSSWENYYVSDRVLDFIQSDLIYWLGNQEGYPMQDMLNRNTSATVGQQTGAFVDCYKAIGSCNAGLDFYYSHNGDPFPNATSVDKRDNVDRIAGELHFLRAFAYFHNVRRHCPPYNPDGNNDDKILPYRVSFPESLEEATNPEYATTEKIYRLIISDLKKAKKLLPTEYRSTMHEAYQYGRANSYAAATQLARVYFQMHKMDSALMQLNYVINSGKYELAEEPIDNFNKQELGNESPEVIWYMLWSDPVRGQHFGPKKFTLVTKCHYPAQGGGRGDNWSLCPWNQFTLSTKALDKIGWMADPLNGDYAETDKARFDKRYTQLHYRMEGYKKPPADVTKYLTDSKYKGVERPIVYIDKYFRSEVGMHQHVPIMRLAELYLKRAVIRFMQGNKEGAADDLNKVKERAWNAKKAGQPYTPVTAGEITKEMIDAEWIKELSTEGHRLHYLFALRRDVGPGDRAESRPNQVLTPPYSNYYWEIPQSELDFKESGSDTTSTD
jgi:hypothetical protein